MPPDLNVTPVYEPPVSATLLPSQGPTSGATLVPLPSQEPSPAPDPAVTDHVTGIVAFAGFNVVVLAMYLGASLIFARR